jgi:hypothetical protein
MKIRYHRFGDTFLRVEDPEDRGRKFLQNSGTSLPNYMASHPRREQPLITVPATCRMHI